MITKKQFLDILEPEGCRCLDGKDNCEYCKLKEDIENKYN